MVSPVERDGPAGGSLLARLRRPRADERTRLAVLADPHLSTGAEGSSKLFEHTEAHLANAVADVRRRDVAALACVGDLTKDGEPWNFDRFDELLADLPVPFYAVPGNHDVPKTGDDHEPTPVSTFAERYAPPGQEFPFHVRVGGIDLLGVNTAGDRSVLHDSHEGLVTDDQLDALAGMLEGAETPVVLAHHNLPAMAAQLREHRDRAEPDMFVPPELRSPEPLVDLLVERDVPLLFTGHLHLPSAASEGTVREIMAPTTCSFPQGYLLVDVGPAGTDVWFVPVADFDGTVRGYRERSTDSVTARGLTGMAAVRLAQFPLVEER